MPHDRFVHLHTLSAFSLLKSSLHIHDLVKCVADDGIRSVALTDYMNLHGCVSFFDACMRAGIKPIIGAELALENISPAIPVEPHKPLTYEVVVLAEDIEGYSRLCELLTRAHTDENMRVPYVKKEWFEELAGKWFVLTGGRDGELFKHIAAQNEDAARTTLSWLVHAAGPGHCYVELGWHESEDEKKVMPALISLARTQNVPLVAAHKCMYLTRRDAVAVECLRHIAEGTTVKTAKELKPEVDTHYVTRADDMIAAFHDIPEAVKNTSVIANQCGVELPVGQEFRMPHYAPPDGMKPKQYLHMLCEEGLKKRYPGWDASEEGGNKELTKKKRQTIEKRLEHEMKVLADMGFISYILIVADFVRYARSQNISVGPGRGSAAGSLVCYLTGITEIDPIKYGLIFERFLNPSRKKMPDIDIDFCERRRDEIIEYVREKYGEDNVAHIATFSTLRYRAALRDAGRVVRAHDKLIDQLSAIITETAKGGVRYNVITQAKKDNVRLHEVYRDNTTARIVIELAEMIEGLPRNLSTHAAGILIAPEPLRQRMPLIRGADGGLMSHYDMYSVGRLGYLKMDFLGLTTLTILDDACQLIEASTGEKLRVEDIPKDDIATYTYLQSGEVLGVFQLEKSKGMQRLVIDIQPTTFVDIIAVLALYRPGAMSSRSSYVARKHGREEVTYAHPALKPILKETYGVLVYQEQVMQIAHDMCGYTMAEADNLRQIMSKKQTGRIEKERERFMTRAKEKEIDETLAKQLFDNIAKFAGYGFNKSHATAYACVAYWTAYMKVHYPAPFYAALMNMRAGDASKTMEILRVCRSANVAVRAPDINKSKSNFSVEKLKDATTYTLIYGLHAIRGIGPRIADAIVKERDESGNYTSLDNLVQRLGHSFCTRPVLDALIKSGACDSLDVPRQRMCLIAEDITAAWSKDPTSEFQRSFFTSFDEQSTTPVRQFSSIDEWDTRTKLGFEKDALGVYLSAHPLDAYGPVWHAMSTEDSRATGFVADEDDDMDSGFESNTRVVMGGVVIGINWKRSKRGTDYGIIQIEDYYGTCEVILWQEAVDIYRDHIKEDAVWFFQGELRTSYGRRSLSARRAAECEAALEKWPRAVLLSLSQSSSGQSLEKIKEVIDTCPGNIPVVVDIRGAGKTQRLHLPEEYSLHITVASLTALNECNGLLSLRCVCDDETL